MSHLNWKDRPHECLHTREVSAQCHCVQHTNYIDRPSYKNYPVHSNIRDDSRLSCHSVDHLRTPHSSTGRFRGSCNVATPHACDINLDPDSNYVKCPHNLIHQQAPLCCQSSVDLTRRRDYFGELPAQASVPLRRCAPPERRGSTNYIHTWCEPEMDSHPHRPVYSPTEEITPYSYAPERYPLRSINHSLVHSLCSSSSQSLLNDSRTEKLIDEEVNRRVNREMEKIINSLPRDLGIAVVEHTRPTPITLVSNCDNNGNQNERRFRHDKILPSHSKLCSPDSSMCITGFPAFTDSNPTSRDNSPLIESKVRESTTFHRFIRRANSRMNGCSLEPNHTVNNDSYFSEGLPVNQIDSKALETVENNITSHTFIKPVCKRSSGESASTINADHERNYVTNGSLLGRVSVSTDVEIDKLVVGRKAQRNSNECLEFRTFADTVVQQEDVREKVSTKQMTGHDTVNYFLTAYNGRNHIPN